MSEKVKLGELGEIVSGSTPKTNIKEYWDGDVLWITPAEIQEDDYYIADTQRKITNLAVEKTNLKLLPKGTILLSSRAPIGKIAICDNDMYCNQGFKNIICSDKIENRYIYYFLKHNIEYIKSLGRGATFKEISKGIVENIEIPYIEKKEQIEIANKLDKITEILKIRKQQIKQFDEIIKSQFVEMFENEKYPKKTINELTNKITDGSHNPPTGIAENEGYMMLSSQNIINNSINYENVRFLKKEDFEKENLRTNLNRGDVLLTIVGTVGRTAIITDETNITLQRSVAVLKPTKEINSIYLVGAINSDDVIRQLNKGAKGVAQKGIYLNDIKKILIAVPPIELQNQFAEIVKQIDKQKFESAIKAKKEIERIQKNIFEKWGR